MRIALHPFFAGDPAAPEAARSDEALAAALERSFVELAASGDVLIERFYSQLFETYPAVRPLFPSDMTAQRRKLLESLRLVIENVRRPEIVRTTLAELGRRHIGYGVKPEHYPVVVDCLLTAMKEVAGERWTADLAADWRTALELVSHFMLAGAGAAGIPPDATNT